MRIDRKTDRWIVRYIELDRKSWIHARKMGIKETERERDGDSDSNENDHQLVDT